MKIILMCLIASLLFVGILPIIHAENVPEWVKNTAGWWAADAISEKEFVNAILTNANLSGANLNCVGHEICTVN